MKNTSILTASAIIALGLLASNVANAGVSGNRGGNARAGHASSRSGNFSNHSSAGSHTFSRGVASASTSHSGHAYNSTGLTTNVSITGKAGNTFVRNANTTVDSQTIDTQSTEIKHSVSKTHQNDAGDSVSHAKITTLDSSTGTVEHTRKSVAFDNDQSVTTSRSVKTTATSHSDGTKELQHLVSTGSQSYGTDLNSRNVATTISTQGITHDASSQAYLPDGQTLVQRNGHTSINQDANGNTQLTQTSTISKYLEEANVWTVGFDRHHTGS